MSTAGNKASKGLAVKPRGAERKERKTKHPTEAQLLLQDVLRETSHDWIEEWPLIPDRKFRYDWVSHRFKLAVELHGATWQSGRHTRGAGFQRDREKMNAAQVQGWNVLEFTTEDVLQGRAEQTIKAWLAAHP